MRRNDIDICAEILNIAREGARKTRIVYRANLNFTIVKNYLRRLTEWDLLKKDGAEYKTTEKGTEYVRQYQALREAQT